MSRSGFCYSPVEPDEEELALMRQLDELHLGYPFFGSRMMTQMLKRQGYLVNRKRIQRLMRTMGLESLAPKPGTFFGDSSIDRVNQVWAADITSIPMARGFVYLVAVIDWYSRRVLSWRLSITMETDFCVGALQDALARFGKPEIFNTDQGAQFTADSFSQALRTCGIKISMDGQGRFVDNIFVERL